MKKWILGCLIVAALAMGSSYIFIPSTLEVAVVRNVNIFPDAITRFLQSPNKLDSCFKIVATKKDRIYQYKGYNYSITNFLYNITQIDINSNEITSKSNLMLGNITPDSVGVFWTASVKTSLNPFKRIRQYYDAVNLKTSMADIMDGIKKYLNQQVNIYGITVKEIEVSDSTLISTKFRTNHEPSVAETYEQIKKLEDYAKANNANTTNPPMLNTKKIDAANFETMVALPVNKVLAETKDIYLKRVPYKGKMFVSEVQGGPATIKNSFKQFDIYVIDSKRSVVAIPFEMLITNRSTQSDSTKWITRLYYPII